MYIVHQNTTIYYKIILYYYIIYSLNNTDTAYWQTRDRGGLQIRNCLILVCPLNISN